jgi:energy-coupling factor transporter ATP-binding protein EcfA2
MIERLDLKFGSRPDQHRVSFAPGTMTVFVGPNNGGKSLLLEDIKQLFCYVAPGPIGFGPQAARPNLTILENLSSRELTPEELSELYANRWNTDDIFLGSLLEGDQGLPGQGAVSREVIVAWQEQREPHMKHQAETAARRMLVLKLGTKDRLHLLRPRPAGNMRQAPRNTFQVLFREDDRRLLLRKETFEAFGLYFVLDNMDGGELRAAMSAQVPDIVVERSRTEAAFEFFRLCIPCEQMSDGVNAYTGILASVLCADQRLVLIDEPEAFLAPTLSRRMGTLLSDLASKRLGNVIAATHSSDFLIGCIESGRAVNIVRLTYDRATDAPTARLLEADRLKIIMQDPYLRSTGMLDALFHKGAIVGEHDVDRAFYSEINERLLRYSHGGVRNCVFVNGHGWQSLKEIIRPLREMGVPAAAVVDLDVIKKPELADLLEAASVPLNLRSSLGGMRGQADGAFRAKNLQSGDGMAQLPVEDRACAETLIKTLEEYGVFIVSVGRAEKWLESLHVDASKRNWLPAMFARLGSDPDETGYVKPEAGDVWDFVRNVGHWIGNPHRKGMPV